MRKKVASVALHVDCDNLWAYEEEFEIPFSGNNSSIYSVALMRFLEIAKEFQVKITFFVVASDLGIPECLSFCKLAISAGHRIANHTKDHSLNFSSLSDLETQRQIKEADSIISDSLGVKAVGFRAPGYFLNKNILKTLRDLDYTYDSSVLPGFGFYSVYLYKWLRSARNSKKILGNPKYVLASRSTLSVGKKMDGNLFYEVPVATLPFFRMPVHSTFIYLLGKTYLDFALRLIKKSKKHHVFLFHAIDLLPQMAGNSYTKIPAFWRTINYRESVVRKVMKFSKDTGSILTEKYVEELKQDNISRSILFNALD